MGRSDARRPNARRRPWFEFSENLAAAFTRGGRRHNLNRRAGKDAPEGGAYVFTGHVHVATVVEVAQLLEAPRLESVRSTRLPSRAPHLPPLVTHSTPPNAKETTPFNSVSHSYENNLWISSK